MKKIIETLSKSNGLLIQHLNYNELDVLFAHYDEKNDFFLFLFDGFVELHQKLKTDIDNHNLEYAINNMVYNMLQTDELRIYQDRYIGHNISIVLVLSGVNEDNEIGLFKIEENVYTSKKYVLHYDESNLIELKGRLNAEEASDVSISLNRLVKNHSDLLKESNDKSGWYELLLRLFIKIPFLNYINTDTNSLELITMENTLMIALASDQKELVNEINKIDVKNIAAIETHILQKYKN